MQYATQVYDFKNFAVTDHECPVSAVFQWSPRRYIILAFHRSVIRDLYYVKLYDCQVLVGIHLLSGNFVPGGITCVCCYNHCHSMVILNLMLLRDFELYRMIFMTTCLPLNIFQTFLTRKFLSKNNAKVVKKQVRYYYVISSWRNNSSSEAGVYVLLFTVYDSNSCGSCLCLAKHMTRQPPQHLFT
jgi:hypothetical protein